MKAAANMKDVDLDLLLPGIKINTSATDFYPIEQQQMMKFNAKDNRWDFFGPILSGEVRGS
jgi:branched-chain amino acid transport system substrate-binding protein